MTFVPRHRRQAAVVLLALTGSLAMAGCQLNGPIATEPTSQGSTVSTSEFSTLDAAGVDRIRTGRTARLDMSSGTLQKADVRVTADSYGPEIKVKDGGKIALTIVGPAGEIEGETDRIRFNTTDARADFSEVTYFLTTGSMDGYVSLIHEGVDKYGISSEVAERWIDSMGKRPRDKSDFALDPGTSTGLSVTYDLRYDGAKDTQVIIVHVAPAS
ncbi:hypothetical protein V3C33_17845 [Micrococcaceae bacterium Sec5.7]